MIGAMTARTTRLDAWKASRASLILRDIGQYVMYAGLRFYHDRGMQAASALTFTTLLALVPLLTIAFAIFSAFPAFQAAQGLIETLLFENLVPEVGGQVRGYIADFTRNTTNLTAVGVVALGVSAVLLLATVESTLNAIWRVERDRPILGRLVIYWGLLTFGPLLLGASFSLTSNVFSVAQQLVNDLTGDGANYVNLAIESERWLLERPLAAALQTVTFTVLFMIVPARPVRIRDALIGGAVTGVSFEILKWGFKIYLVSFPTYQTIYGTLAVFPIFLIWLYLSWTVVIIGAVFAASFPEWWKTRNPTVGIELNPARRLEAAIAVLAVLAQQSRRGGTTAPDVLEENLPLDARDGVVEALRQRGYLATTDEESFVLSRDLYVTTVADLARDLGLALGHSPGDAGQGDSDVEEELDARVGPVVEVLQELGRAEDRILSRPLSEVIGKIATPDDPSQVVPLSSSPAGLTGG